MKLDKIALRNWAWENCLIDGDSTTLLVALALVEYTFIESGYAHVGNAKLIAKTGLAQRTITNSISKLEEAGAWRVQRITGHASKFFPVLSYEATPAGDAPPQEMHPRSICHTPPQEMLGTPAGDATITSSSTRELQDVVNPASAHAADGNEIEPLFIIEEKSAPKPQVKKPQAESDRFAWAIASKVEIASGGLTSKAAARGVIATAVSKGGYTPEQVEKAALAIAAQRQPLSTALLYGVIDGKRTPDGGFINTNTTSSNRPQSAATSVMAASKGQIETVEDPSGIDWDAFFNSGK